MKKWPQLFGWIGLAAILLLFQTNVTGAVWYGQNGIYEANWATNPPNAATLGASSTNGNALLNGMVNPNGAPTMAWFGWGANAACSNATQTIDIGAGTTNSLMNASLTGLTSGVAYYYRVVASNSFGLTTGQVEIVQSPQIILNEANPMTNECHAPFIDPGASAMAAPKAIAAGTDYSMALKYDGTVAPWGGSGNGETSIPVGLSNVVAIAAGSFHGLALKGDGTVVGWGDGYYGDTTPPVNLSNAVAIAAGSYYSLALNKNGVVVGWGDNTYGQINVPSGLHNVTAIAAGSFHALALSKNGQVIGWGYNADGEINIPVGLSNVVAIAAGWNQSIALKSDGSVAGWGKTTIPPGLSNVVAIASGLFHNLALKKDGTVIGWGLDDDGSISGMESLTNVIAIAAGGYHSMAVTSDGTLIAVGYDEYGQTDVPGNLGGDIIESGAVDYNDPGIYSLTYTATNSLGGVGTATRTVAVVDTTPPSLTLLGSNPLVMPVNTTFVDPGATAMDLCAGDLTSSIIVTGNVNTTILGTNTLTYTVTDSSGNTASTNRTVITVIGAPFVNTLAASSTRNGAILLGTVNPNGGSTEAWFEWGTNILHGKVTIPIAEGHGLTNVTLSSPLGGLIPGVSYHYQIVAANSAGRSNGRDVVFQNPPANVQAPAIMLRGANPLTNVCDSPFIDPGAVVVAPLAAIAAGDSYSAALKTDGTVATWGNTVVDSGNSTVPPGLSNVAAISAGYIHCLALKTNGMVVGWGDNSFGETNTPAGLSNVVAVSAGWGFSLALKSDGTVVGWGLGATNPPGYDGLNFGQAKVPADLGHVVAIAAGFDSSVALKSDGTVVSWGYPQPYNGSIFPYFVGVIPPENLSNVVAITTGDDFALALKSDGTVVGWGYSGEGQATVPAGLSNVVAIAAGFYHSLALKRDGTVVGWGDDFYGEATPPPNLTKVIAISAGAYHSLALRSDGTVVGWGMDFYGESDITTSGTNLVTRIPASGVVNANYPSTYTLTYAAANSLGHVGRVTRTVVVVDTTAPGITITSPTNSMIVSNATSTVTGTTTDNVAVANVFYSLNNGIWKNAAGTANWNAVVTLVQETNTLSAYAVDTSDNKSATNNVSFVSLLGGPLRIITTSLSSGTNGVAYSQTLGVTGGHPPYTWTKVSGTLPPGLSLAINGVISGTPLASGTSIFTVRVADTVSAFWSRPLTLVIDRNTMPFRPVLNSAGHFSENQFRMQLDGIAGQNYTLQMSTNLASTNWISILVTNAPVGSFFITDPNATNVGRYYRIIVGP